MITIAEKNDAFRKASLTRPQPDGKAVMTRGIADLPAKTRLQVLANVHACTHFPKADDPYGEHDFGVVALPGVPRIFWKIEYFADEQMEFGAEDPLHCYRIMKIMLAEEY